jgi:hypothetical protein
VIREALDVAARARQSRERFETPRPACLAVGVDQAERLFDEIDADLARRFAALLAALVRERLACVIVALRSDAYARFQSVDPFIKLRAVGATLDVAPPNAAELEEIVTQPVEACEPRLSFETQDGRSLAARLVADAKGGDALPLLQMTLARLYDAEARRGDGLLRHADYAGMDQAVTETANEALAEVTEAARAELPALLTGLVRSFSDDPLSGQPIPIVAPLNRRMFESASLSRKALIDAFIEKRLLAARRMTRSCASGRKRARSCGRRPILFRRATRSSLSFMPGKKSRKLARRIILRFPPRSSLRRKGLSRGCPIYQTRCAISSLPQRTLRKLRRGVNASNRRSCTRICRPR